jgi:hypothetical protein
MSQSTSAAPKGPRGTNAFELLLTKEGEDYRAQVLLSPIGKVPGAPFSRATIATIDGAEIEQLRQAFVTGTATADDHDRIKQIGATLFQAAFATLIGSTFSESFYHAVARSGALRIRLRVEDDELAMLPWEMLFNAETVGYLATSKRFTLARFIRPVVPTSQRKATKLPIRILVHVSQDSTDTPRAYSLQSGREIQLIKKALGDLLEDGSVEVHKTSGGDWDTLSRAIDDNKPRIDILHIIGHGGLLRGQGGLRMGDQLINASTLSMKLEDSGITLVVLNTCQSAKGRPTDIFAGIAQSLVRTAVPAAIAMQFSVTDDAAVKFSSALYTAIAKAVPLDIAVTSGRIGMADQNSFEWITPILYIANADASLFSIPPPRPSKYRQKIPLSKVEEHREKRRRKLASHA